MPADPTAWRSFLKRTVQQVRKKKNLSREMCHPSVRQLWDLISTHADVRMLFTLMLEQVPLTPPYNTNPAGGPEFRDWKELLFFLRTCCTVRLRKLRQAVGSAGIHPPRRCLM